MYKHFIQKRAYRFRRFCRAKYAAFRSVHLEVCIGHVASYIAEKQLVKSKITNTLVCFVALMCSPLALFADDETDGFDIQNLSEVSVVAVKQQVAGEALHVVSTITAQQLQSFPTTTLNELLDYLPSIDIRTRGANGAQADISMRGGTFDQVLILLNGVNIIDNQPVLGCTGGAITSDEFVNGPIYLQGDHSDADFRNMVLTPIVK